MAKADSGMLFLSCVGLSITARCPISCSHCIIEAGPHRTEEMSVDDAEDWLRQIASYREGHIKSVIVTGGEPFFNRPLLARILESAELHGLVLAVMTNGFWASTPEKAKATLSALPQIRMLGVSTDVYHQKFIPISRVKNALLAARELGIPHNAAVCFEDESDPKYQSTCRELREVLSEEQILGSRTLTAGRAVHFRHCNVGNATLPGACTAADFPTIFPDGRLIGCMGIVHELPSGHPLNFGSLREESLADLLDRAETNLALQIIRLWGPKKLDFMLRTYGWMPKETDLPVVSRHCGLCYGLQPEAGLKTALRKMNEDRALIEKIAYARYYYLQETSMLERLEVAAC